MNDYSDPQLKQFGPYTIKKKIVGGGMAELFLGETTGPGGFSKPVVIKMIHHELGNDPRFVSMFTDEARMVAGLVHGNIVPIFDFGSVDGRAYLVMEFIDGVDLETLTETCRTRGITLSPEVVLWIGIGAASGLHYAHCAKDSSGTPLEIVHCDVSPHNILVSRAGEVKLCDFGIASSDTNKRDTDVGVIKGKLHYLSPEQVSDKKLDKRSDVFSLGVTLYQMLAGHHPVPNGTGVVVLRTLSEGDSYPSLSEVAPWLDESLTRTIDKAISFDPNQRHQDAEELRQELSHSLHQKYPDFSPSLLAEIVMQVQSEAIHENADTPDSVSRSQLASFASEIREITKKRQARSRTINFKAKSLPITLGIIAVIMLAGLLSWWLGGDDGSSVKEPAQKVQTLKSQVQPQRSVSKTASTLTVSNKVQTKLPSVIVDSGVAILPAQQQAVKPVRVSRKFGFLNANASPWANVKIDGKPYGSTPVLKIKLSVGKHRAVFFNPETNAKITRRFIVNEGKTTRLIVEMEK